MAACSPRPQKAAPAPAPKDVGFRTSTDSESSCVQRLIIPYIEQARSTYPQARQRFLGGFPPGYRLELVTQLHDSLDHFEQVYVLVDSIVGSRVFGRINDDIYVVQGYKKGMAHSFDEAELYDWTITDPSG